MFTCLNCLRRVIWSLPAFDLEAALVEKAIFLPSKKSNASAASYSSRRVHSTIASIQRGHHRRLLDKAFNKSTFRIGPTRSERLNGPSAVSRRNAKAVAANRHHLDRDDDPAPNQPVWATSVDRALRTELAWTGGDPLKLARAVLDKLKAADPSRALEMVRASEKIPGAGGPKVVDNVVSWNHIMDYYMSERMTREAFKVFNEMKKRGHKPDAHTFTIMLRGYTMNHRNYKAVDEAMSVYDSIWRPESSVKPSIIHSNAIINCLGRALKMDALWSVAARLPERGPGSPDKWTYTTLLNTMQACALRDARQLAETDGDHEAAAKLMQSTIREGKRLWEDIISRWRAGDVNIDQTLVCAMGRLLLLGAREDWDDVFSLVEQTMRLPRREPPRQFRRPKGDQDPASNLTLPSPQSRYDSSGLRRLESAVAEEEAPSTAQNEFAVVDLSDRPNQGMSARDVISPYAMVGSNVLSLLIETSTKLKAISIGKAYWEALTDPKNEPFVAPDDENLGTYLRLLRISRSSTAVCQLLRNPPPGSLAGTWYKRGTFVLAMSTCARDFKNPNVFGSASTILDLMQANLPEPVLKVMTMYLSLAVITTPGVSSEMTGNFRLQAGGNNLIRALHRLQQPALHYRSLLQKLREEQLDRHWKEYASDVGKKRAKEDDARPPRAPAFAPSEELLEYMQSLNSAYDKLLNYRLKMTNQMAEEFTENKRDLSRALKQIQPEKTAPPSLSAPRPTDPADLLMDDDRELKSSRYPDKLATSRTITALERKMTTLEKKMRGPKLVNLEQRHPFLTELKPRDQRRWSSAD